MTETKSIKDIGPVDGRWLFFGGAYSNLQALEALQKWADDNAYAADHIICTGDVGGYCANPIECYDLVRNWQIHTIAGNVELQLRDAADDCGCDFTTDGRCDTLSRTWYSYLRKSMNDTTLTYLHSLPHHLTFTCAGRRFMVVHGSWFKTAEFIFHSTPWQIKQANIEAANADVIVAGHCGLPFMHEARGFTWINPGVIGMPANDGAQNVWFATLQIVDKNPIFRFHELAYDFTKARQSMIENGLPLSYANTLETGIWDNCEILPEAEATAQGQKINL